MQAVWLKLFLVFTVLSTVVTSEVIHAKHAIYFSGHEHFEKGELEDALGVENKSFFQFWKADDPRIHDDLIPTLESSLKSFYSLEGFYDANFTVKQRDRTLHVSISENEPVRVRDINISSDYDISQFVTFNKDEIFRSKKFTAIKTQIISALLKEGYCSYELDTKAYVDLDAHHVDVRYYLKKGGVCTFGKLSTSGLATIDDDVIRSRVRAVEGERFSTELVQETSNELYELKAFDSVLINVDRKIYNVIPVDIYFKEVEKPYHFEIGAGYDTYVGPRIHSTITKYNFFGDAQAATLQAMWSDKEQLLIGRFEKPALLNLFGYYIDLGTRFGYSNLEFEGFQEEKSFLNGYLEHNNGRLKLRGGLAIEHIQIDALDNLRDGEVLQQAVNEGLFLLTYSYIDAVYDARDSKLNPQYGYYLAAYGEAGFSNEDETSAYHKTRYEGRIIYTISDLTLAAVGKVGVVEAASEDGLPESKYFFGGGSFSNRAYGYRELGVILSPTEDSINGASSMANLSFEADYPVWDALYGALFVDNTLLTDESYDFNGDIITSAGMGVRYMTPIGPFKLDVGFNVKDPSIYGISFQIGQSF